MIKKMKGYLFCIVLCLNFFVSLPMNSVKATTEAIEPAQIEYKLLTDTETDSEGHKVDETEPKQNQNQNEADDIGESFNDISQWFQNHWFWFVGLILLLILCYIGLGKLEKRKKFFIS